MSGRGLMGEPLSAGKAVTEEVSGPTGGALLRILTSNSATPDALAVCTNLQALAVCGVVNILGAPRALPAYPGLEPGGTLRCPALS